MTISKAAIAAAIKGGWKPFEWSVKPRVTTISNGEAYFKEPHESALSRKFQVIALDPSFWQSLGKALGWDIPNRKEPSEARPPWRYKAIHFYDLVLTGDDTDAFWDELLKP